MAHLNAARYARVEPAVLQPARVFLDLSGEDIRGRMYLTADASGADMCLRPEYTIPVCRDYLASPKAGKPAAFSYCGPVFRHRAGLPGEFIQAGLENFGRADPDAADAEILSLALEAAEAAGAGPVKVKLGDVGLFVALLERLDLPQAFQRKLRRGFGQGQALAALADDGASAAATDHSGVLAALAGADKGGARALVSDLLSIAGISSVGGRTTGEIAERFLEQSAARATGGAPQEKRDLIARYLAIKGDPDMAATRLRVLADDAKLDLDAAIDALEMRTGYMAARGLDVAQFEFSTAFGRSLDYYTGFVFEAHDPKRADGRPLIGGGRYDGLLKTLGAANAIPAVGAAIWVERLGEQRLGEQRLGEQRLGAPEAAQ